jgi:rhamnogalacturonan endolyase
MPTLMHDHTYRMGICWQNTAYNQPPHLGYYLPDAMLPHFDNEERYAISAVAGQPVDFQCHAVYTTGIIVAGCQMPDGTKKSYSLPEGLTQHFDKDTKAWTLTGTLAEEGTYMLMMQLTGVNKEKAVDTLIVNVSRESSDIEYIKVEPTRRQKAAAAAYDLLGRRVDARPLRSKKRVVVGKGYKTIE